ncbi:MAG: winged helix-turn-helix domain-containing protein [Lachnospiraceae bacterium]|jgi:DNA-binding transcriptional regulator YhcF (GntR family)|nr:winged helix-turn-helix domain-containing protein [Lachnospiraceae bacterium]
MESIIDKMTSNAYKVLKYMYSCQIELPDGTKYIPLSQVEMAPLIGVSTITMNKLFKQLKDDNLLLPIEGKRGKYELTDKAIIIIRDMKKLENKLEGNK